MNEYTKSHTYKRMLELGKCVQHKEMKGQRTKAKYMTVISNHFTEKQEIQIKTNL